MIKIIAIILVLLQILLFIIYFGKFAAKWLNPSSKSKPVWVADRDRVLLFYSITFVITSSILIQSIEKHSPYFEYLTLILIVVMTAMMILFYYRKFTVFDQKNIEKNHLIAEATPRFIKEWTNQQQSIENENNKKLQSFWKVTKLSDVEINKLFNYLIENKCMTGGYSDFKMIFDNATPKNKLNWIDTKGYQSKSKKVTYVLLFDFCHNILFQNKEHFLAIDRKNFIKFIINSFEFAGEIKKYSSVNTAYTNWKNENKLTDFFKA